MSTPFVPDDFEVPLELVTDRFRLEPLGPEHNERDHDAWMSSIDHIRATPGFGDGTWGPDRWPVEMTIEQNLGDLEMHWGEFQRASKRLTPRVLFFPGKPKPWALAPSRIYPFITNNYRIAAREAA